jgi:hypothetical protein
VTPPPLFDPRRDSGPMPATEGPGPSHEDTKPTINLNEAIIVRLEALADITKETRDTQKNMSIQLDRLEGSQDAQGHRLKGVEQELGNLTHKVREVEGIARQGRETANEAVKRTSETRVEFNGSLLGVASAQGLVAERLHTIDGRTASIVEQNSSQTLTLEKVKQYSQLIAALTAAVALALGAGFNAWSSVVSPHAPPGPPLSAGQSSGTAPPR